MTHPDSAAPRAPLAAVVAEQARVDGAGHAGGASHAVEPHAAPASCRNCDAAMHGPWCAACGQHAALADPTARELAHDAVQELLNIDGKILGTLRLLFTRPGFLTAEHLRGRRARYVAPIRLYLTCSVVYFLVAAVADPVEKAVAENRDRNVRITATEDGAPSRRPVDADSVARTLETSGAERHGVTRTVFRQAARVQRDRIGFARTMRDTVPKIFFVFVPVFAWIVSLVYRRRGNYPAHLFFALHTFAFAFATAAIGEVVGLAPGTSFIVGWALMALWAWYALRALREVYGGSFGGTVARAAAITALGLLAFAAIGSLGVAIVFFAF